MGFIPTNKSIITFKDDNPYLSIVQPSTTRLLYAEFRDSNLDVNGTNSNIPVTAIAINGVDESIISDGPRAIYNGTGSVLFRIDFDYHRGPLNADDILDTDPKLDGFLGDEENVDLYDPQIMAIAETIRQDGKQSKYDLVSRTIRWVYENIRHTSLPKPALEQMAAIIREQPSHYNGINAEQVVLQFADNLTVDGAIQSHIDIVKTRLRDTASRAYVDEKEMSQSEIYIADLIGRRIGGSQNSIWFLGFYTSARKTLEYRSGQCMGRSRLLTSLIRNQGIPAKFVDGLQYGYEGGEGTHKWTAVYLEPYGWVEHDNSLQFKLEGFEGDCHAYHLGITSAKPELTVFGDRTKPSEQKFNDAIKMLDDKHPKELDFLETLKSS